MSFSLQYRRLFKVSVRESGSTIALPGFSFRPTLETRTRLKDHQLVFRPRETGFEVYYTLNLLAADPLLGRINHRVKFSFSSLQSDPDFFARYQPDFTQNFGAQLYLDNLTQNGDIQPDTKQSLSVDDSVQVIDAMKIYPSTFVLQTYLKENEAPPTQYRILDKFDPTKTVMEIPVQSGNTSQIATKVDMSSYPLGAYLLESDGIDFTRRTIYTAEFTGSSIQGLVDIYWETPQSTVSSEGVSYIIQFNRR